VNIASRVQELADAGEIWISGEVWSYPGVRELLEPYPAEPGTAELRGVGRPLAVRRIGAPGQAVPA
jgi:class 3 adenylate cyclase